MCSLVVQRPVPAHGVHNAFVAPHVSMLPGVYVVRIHDGSLTVSTSTRAATHATLLT